MIDRYLAEVATCRTVNELNLRHIGLTNVMTPRELMQLWQLVSGPEWVFPENPGLDAARVEQLERTVFDNVARIMRDIEFSAKPVAEPFERRVLAKALTLFTSPGDTAARTLLVCFAGNAGRLMMPTPALLQHFDAARVDVAILVDLRKTGYRTGIEALGDSLGEVITSLPGRLTPWRYRRIAAFGTSGGALPAVLAGLRLGASAVLAVGGNHPDDPRWQDEDGRGAPALLVEARQGPGRRTRLALAFGAQSPNDETAAKALAELLDATLVPVSDPAGPVRHGALHPLVAQQQLAEFLAGHLGL